ncbi:MAG: peptide chain release factor-like protein [Desulfobacula sp.]|nr:peptide chain release factor-like protein [Desulfobacula sp.]
MGPDKSKIRALEKKMVALGIKKEDIEQRFIKASGKGGQKVNKSSSAVFLKHIKTNLSVKCGKSRSQNLNRFLALRRLVEKIELKLTGVIDKQPSKIEKIRKQKKTRKRKAYKKQITGE